jgi:hypothetical protein
MALKTYYLVGAVERTKSLEISGSIAKPSLDLEWADGMVGVCPVFSNYRKARKYANKRSKVFTFTAEVADA